MTDAPIIVECLDDGEIWRSIPSAPAYAASSCGRIKRTAVTHGGFGSKRIPKGVLKQRPLPTGHMQVTISMNNKRMTRLVHRLVAEAFIANDDPSKNCVCHRDDDPRNNALSNLFWGSKADNSADMVSKNRQKRGSEIVQSKLSEDDVREIKRMLLRGENQYKIAKQFNVTQSNISMISTGQIWRHI